MDKSLWGMMYVCIVSKYVPYDIYELRKGKIITL